MGKSFLSSVAVIALVLVTGVAGPVQAADTYTVDPVHTSVSFKIDHLGISTVHGRFNQYSGEFTIDKDDPTQSSFTFSIKAESVDTNNTKRDGHLRSGDFFNVKQFPTIGFKSTAVKAAEGGYRVTGDLTMHGVTKSVRFVLKGGKTANFFGGVRIGFTTELTLKRSDFGMDKMQPAIGDEVQIAIGVEAVQK